MKNQYRVPSHDICMGDPAPFGQRWEVRIPLPLAGIGDLGAALHSRYSEYRPGDIVNVCSFATRAYNLLVEVAAFRVVAVDHNQLSLVQVGETVAVPKPVVTDATQIGDSSLVVVERNGAWEVKDEKGNVIDLFVEKVQAERFIADLAKSAKVERPDVPDHAQASAVPAAKAKSKAA